MNIPIFFFCFNSKRCSDNNVLRSQDNNPLFQKEMKIHFVTGEDKKYAKCTATK
jgi:hypothetical protein